MRGISRRGDRELKAKAQSRGDAKEGAVACREKAQKGVKRAGDVNREKRSGFLTEGNEGNKG